MALESDVENGLSVYSLTLAIDAGASRTLRLHVRQPAQPDQPLLFRQQPLIRDDQLVVRRTGGMERAYATQ